MTRKIAALVAAAGAFAITACGSDEPTVAPEAAKSTVEQAAHVTLASETVSGDARKEGLTASFSNAGTVVKDKQVVGLFVVKNAGVAKQVSDQVRQTAPKGAKLIVGRNVMVVYAPAGDDRSAAVEQAVKAL